jgi:predicted nucleotidyltransferase
MDFESHTAKKEVVEYTPTREQLDQVEILHQLVELCKNDDVDIYVMGGYGVDGLYGDLTRNHGDIDILVEEEKIQNFQDIVEQAGFVEDTTNTDRNKKVYRPSNKLSLPETFKIEAGSISLLKKFLPKETPLESIFPREENARLANFSFKTLTLKGQEIVSEIQNARAVEEEWGEYKHRKNFDEIMEILRKR